jgi:hypothetical protein
MAASDVSQMLLSTPKSSSADMQREICLGLLKQLDDSSLEVQANAVKCLARILAVLDLQLVMEILDKLAKQMCTGPESLRDVYGLGIKTFILGLSSSIHAHVSSLLVQLALDFLPTSKSETLDIHLEVLNECLTVCGLSDSGASKNLFNVLMEIVNDPSQKHRTLRKATQCIGSLATRTDDEVFQHVMNVLSNRILSKSLYLCSIGAILRANATCRLKPFMRSISTTLARFLDDVSFVSDNERNDEETETILFCCERILVVDGGVWRFGETFTNKVIRSCLLLMKFNPNYVDEEACDEDYYYSDDEDSSWRVRAAAVRLITRVLSLPSRRDQWSTPRQSDLELTEIFRDTFADILLSRATSENEESVVIQILACLIFLTSKASLKTRIREIAEKLISLRKFKRITHENETVRRLILACTNTEESLSTTRSNRMKVASELDFDDICEKVKSKPALDLASQIISSLNDSIQNGSIPENKLHGSVHALSNLMEYDPCFVKEVDLGPFKHRVDAAAPIRKSIVHFAEILSSMLASYDPTNLGVSPEEFLGSLVCIAIKALKIDLAKGGQELYASAIAILNHVNERNPTIVYLNFSVMIPVIEQVLNSALKSMTVSDQSCVASVVADWFGIVQRCAQSVSAYEGYMPETILKRDQSLLIELGRKLKSDASIDLMKHVWLELIKRENIVVKLV